MPRARARARTHLYAELGEVRELVIEPIPPRLLALRLLLGALRRGARFGAPRAGTSGGAGSRCHRPCRRPILRPALEAVCVARRPAAAVRLRTAAGAVAGAAVAVALAWREEVFEHVQVGEPRVVSTVPVLLLLAVAVVRGRPPVPAVVHLPVRVGALPQLLLVLLHRVHSLQARAAAPLGPPCGGVSVIHGPPTPAAGCVGSQRCGRRPRGRPPRHLPRPRARARPRRSNAPG